MSRAPRWTETDTKEMFTVIGQYVIIFQWMEGKLDQILMLGWGHENWVSSQARLASMSNSEKVSATKDLVLESSDFARVHTRPDWCAKFELLIERLHKERSRRNSLVHSQFLFEFVEAGLPPLISHRGKAQGEVKFDQEHLTKEYQQALISDLMALAMEVNFLHVQLIHDYQAASA